VKLNESMFNEERNIKSIKSSIDYSQIQFQKNEVYKKSNEKFKFLEKREMKKLSPIKVKQLELFSKDERLSPSKNSKN